MGSQEKKQVVKIAQDGLPSDDVTHYAASSEHLRTYDEAARALYKFRAPSLLDLKNPHSYLLVGLLDGTGNDVEQDPLHATSVAKFREQMIELNRSVTRNIELEYLAGPGTQANPIKNKLDGALGYTSLERAETMYAKLVDRAQDVFERDPKAQVSLHVEGFSRGASQVPLLARMVHERGIPNLSRPEYVRDEAVV